MGMCIINFVQSTASIIAVYLLYKFLLGFETRKSKQMFVIALAISVITVTMLPIALEVNEDSDVVKETVIMFSAMFYPLFAFKHKKKLLIPILGLLIVSTVDYLIFIFTSTLKVESYYVSGIMYCLIYVSVCLLTLIVKNRISRDVLGSFSESVSPWFYIVIILADLSAYYDVVVKTDSTYYEEISNGIRMLSTVLMVCALIYIVIKFSKSFRKQKESEIQVDMQLKLYNEMMKKNMDIRRFRHDYKNNLFSLDALIENQKYDEAKKYIEDLNGSLETTRNKYATGNFLADAIITDKADTASAKNINIDFSGTIPEAGISNNDLCTVIANALDNAIRGCEDVAPCTITVESKENSKGVIIRIKNPVPKVVEIKNNRIKTTKLDGENHGIGLNNIKKVADKYGGYIDLSCDERFFEIEVGLYI